MYVYPQSHHHNQDDERIHLPQSFHVPLGKRLSTVPPQTTTDLLSVIIASLNFLIILCQWIDYLLVFCLFSLNMRYIHIVACINSSFFFVAE